MDLASCPCSGINLPRYVYPAVLAVLAEGPLHGYVVLKRLAASSFFHDQPPDQTGVYRMLKVMEEEGLVSSSLEQARGPMKKLYALTERGRHCLAQWVCTLAAHQSFLAGLTDFLRNALEEGERLQSCCRKSSGIAPMLPGKDMQ